MAHTRTATRWKCCNGSQSMASAHCPASVPKGQAAAAAWSCVGTACSHTPANATSAGVASCGDGCGDFSPALRPARGSLSNSRRLLVRWAHGQTGIHSVFQVKRASTSALLAMSSFGKLLAAVAIAFASPLCHAAAVQTESADVEVLGFAQGKNIPWSSNHIPSCVPCLPASHPPSRGIDSRSLRSLKSDSAPRLLIIIFAGVIISPWQVGAQAAQT